MPFRTCHMCAGHRKRQNDRALCSVTVADCQAKGYSPLRRLHPSFTLATGQSFAQVDLPSASGFSHPAGSIDVARAAKAVLSKYSLPWLASHDMCTDMLADLEQSCHRKASFGALLCSSLSWHRAVLPVAVRVHQR